MTHVSKLLRDFFKTSTTLTVHLEGSTTSSLPGSAHHPENIFDRGHIPSFRYLYHSKVLNSSGSSPLRDPLRSKGFISKLEAPTTYHL